MRRARTHRGLSPLVERMRRAGYAVISWDKPGVGESTGQLSETRLLDERAQIVMDAIRTLKARLARWLLGLLVALFFISRAVMFSTFANEAAFLTGTAAAHRADQILAVPVAILSAGAALFTFLAWRRGF